MGPKINIYAIYTLEDKDVMLSLMHHLNSLKEVFDVSIWHDDPILSGEQWKPKNEPRLIQADLVLLLVSNAFMHSEFIKQLEFKLIIDRFKENKSVVIPVIIEPCPWDIDFNSDEYDFNFNELQVLPEEGKPIVDWNSPVKAYDHIVAKIRKVVASISGTNDHEGSVKDIELKASNDQSEDQIAISFNEESEVKRIVEEKERLLHEAEAKRKAEEENKIKEEATSFRIAEEKKRLQGAEAKRKIEKEIRIKEAAVAAKQRAEQELRRKKEVEIKNKTGNADQLKRAVDANGNVEETNRGKTNLKRKVAIGSLSVVIAIVGIWIFSVSKSPAEKQLTPMPKIDAMDVKDSIALANTKIDSLQLIKSSSKLSVGEIYDDGILFEIDTSGRSGKIARREDAGPMSWKDAMTIQEQLGEGWRLSTFDELEIMYRTIGQGATNSGQFADELYWSATSYDENQARLVRFRDGNTSYHYNKGVENRKFRVRAVRDFRR